MSSDHRTSEPRFYVEALVPEDGDWVRWTARPHRAEVAARITERLRKEYPLIDWRMIEVRT